jgi:MarR family transcriptional regulator for hemolysin
MQPLGRHLVFTAKEVRRRFEARLAEAGGSLPVWAVLSALELGSCANQHQLAVELHIEGPTLTRHLDRLEAEGLIERHRDPADRRSVRVEATAAGKELYERLLAVARKTDEELRSGLSEREAETLDRLLTKVEAALSRAPAATGSRSRTLRR